MKKYVKPDLFYESFQLNRHIAACEWDLVNSQSMHICISHGDKQEIYQPYDPTAAVFTEANTNCTAKYDDYCYENGTEDMAKTWISG